MNNLFIKYLASPRHWLGLLAFLLIKLLGHLPLGIQTRLGLGLGRLLLTIAPSRKKIAQTNFNLCFPQLSSQEKHQLLLENFALTGLALVETAACWFTDLSSRHANTRIKGQEHLDAAIASGKGVILLSFHLTSLEIGGCLLGKHYPITAMYKANKNPLIEDFMRQGRLRHIDKLVEQNDVRGAIKALKNQEILWYATDQNYGAKSTVFVPFFGIQTSTITATSKLAKMTGAVIVPFTQKRSNHQQSYELTLHPAITTIPGDSEQADARVINQFLENYLKQDPTDYMWLHQRFRTRPQGEPPIYPPKKKPK